MGRQFQVYLLPSDAVRLIKLLRQEVGLRLLASRSPGPHPIDLESPVHTEAGFTRIDCLLTPDDSISVKSAHLEKQGHWSVNTLFSEVVEFSGCHFDERTLKRGRLFYDSGFYKDEHWHDKSPYFLKWAETLFKTAKKSLKRDSHLDAYVGEDAGRWHRSGGAFVALSIKDHPPSVS
jgi:hypothetical protein